MLSCHHYQKLLKNASQKSENRLCCLTKCCGFVNKFCSVHVDHDWAAKIPINSSNGYSWKSKLSCKH